MRVVVRRVLERASLEPAHHRSDKVGRRGVTLVPKEGVQVIQTQPPAPAPADPELAEVSPA